MIIDQISSHRAVPPLRARRPRSERRAAGWSDGETPLPLAAAGGDLGAATHGDIPDCGLVVYYWAAGHARRNGWLRARALTFRCSLDDYLPKLATSKSVGHSTRSSCNVPERQSPKWRVHCMLRIIIICWPGRHAIRVADMHAVDCGPGRMNSPEA